MNQTFSLIRFGRLLRTYWLDNRRSLLSQMGFMTFVVAFFLVFWVYRSLPIQVERNRVIALLLIGMAMWFVFTVQQVLELHQKERAIAYLLRPASRVEKWLVLILVTGVGFWLAYLTIFTLIDVVGTYYINHKTWSENEWEAIRYGKHPLPISMWFASEGMNLPRILLINLALLHPFALALALIIRRYTLPLVGVVIFVFFIFCLFANRFIVNQLIRLPSVELYSDEPFDDMAGKYNNVAVAIELPQPIGNQLTVGVLLLVVVLLYAAAFFRLKEKEV